MRAYKAHQHIQKGGEKTDMATLLILMVAYLCLNSYKRNAKIKELAKSVSEISESLK